MSKSSRFMIAMVSMFALIACVGVAYGVMTQSEPGLMPSAISLGLDHD